MDDIIIRSYLAGFGKCMWKVFLIKEQIFAPREQDKKYLKHFASSATSEICHL